MLPIADTHVHLLAGLDDGPRTPDEALAMCRMLVDEGARFATALAHQNPEYSENTPDRLRAAAAELAATLKRENVPLHVYPTGEVMLTENTLPEWQNGQLLSMGDHGKYILVEMPHGMFLDVRPLAMELRKQNVRLVIAHAERYPELDQEPSLVTGFIAAGCLIQVTTEELAEPSSSRRAATLKEWAQRGMIHLLGSDGHQLGRREPRLAAGYRKLVHLAGVSAAERIAGIWGPAVLQGEMIRVPPPLPRPKTWFAKLFGG